MILTGSQRHEIAKIAESAEIWEDPTEWDDKGSICLTYRFPSTLNYHHYVEVVIEPDGKRHRVQ